MGNVPDCVGFYMVLTFYHANFIKHLKANIHLYIRKLFNIDSAIANFDILLIIQNIWQNEIYKHVIQETKRFVVN